MEEEQRGERPPAPLTPAEEAVWRGLARVVLVIPEALEAGLLESAWLSPAGERARAESDGCGRGAVLTPAGRARLERAWPR